MARPIIIEIQARDGASRVIRPLVADLRELDDAGNDAASGAKRAGEGVAKAGAQVKNAKDKVDSFVGSLEKISSAAIVMESFNKVMAFTDAGTSVLGLKESFEGLTDSAKISGSTLMTSMRAASKNMISDVDLMKGANKALLNGSAELANALPRLLEIAGASAKATGGDMKPTIITRRTAAQHPGGVQNGCR